MEVPKQTPSASKTSDPWRQAASRTVLVSMGFCLVLALLLVVNYFHSLAYDPINSKELVQLKANLAKDPVNDALKKQIRAIDLQLRQKLARRQSLAQQGAWLLLGGMAVFLLAIKTVTYRKKLPRPEKRQISAEHQHQMAIRASWSVVSLGILAFGAASFYAARSTTFLSASMLKATAAPEPTIATAAPAAPVTPFPTPEEILQNWPRFRGPAGSGAATYTNVPTSWNLQSGENVIWKTEVPLFSPNSPVIWGNRLFLTGATAKKCEVYCFDTQSGKILWQKALDKLPGESDEPPTVSEDTGGYASSTAATDGRRVYAIYANGNIAAWDYSGKTIWAVNLGKPDNSYGYASSLELFQNRLLVLYDQGSAKDNKSKLLALDTLTGSKVWEASPRPVPNSWATPILIRAANRDQVITCGNPWVISYDPANGSELWRAKVLYGEVTPSPIFANGLVYTVMDGEKLTALKPDGTGDVTKSNVVWNAEDGLPDICSPLCDGQRIYLLNSSGLLTCYDAQGGKKLWEKELELSFKASPGLAGHSIYLCSDKGLCIVLQAGPEYKEVARSDLGEELLASPAFCDGRLYIRGKQHLFCLGTRAK